MKNFRKTSFAIVFALYYGTVAYAGNGQGNGPPETPPGHNKVISSVDNNQTNTLTGGNSVATTGNQTLTGGNSNATSNANSSTQSTATSQGGTGGTSYATGGMGGTSTATGGTSASTSISAGGNSNATGGNATGGTSTSTATGGMATGGTSSSISTGGTATTGASTSSSSSGPSTSSSITGASTSTSKSGDSSAVTGASTSSVNVEIGCTSNCGSNTIDGEIADKRIAADKEIAAGHDQALRDVANSKIRNTPSMLSAALVSSNDTCMGSTSGSVATPGFGLSLGTTWTDTNCIMLKNSQVLWNMGFRAASLALLCNEEKIKSALETTGYACPAKPAQ